mgnify:CR=1 FL=1
MKSLANANLQESIKGQVITPEDSEYDQRRSVFYGGIDRRPAIIVRAADAKDVLQTIALARQSGLPFAVRSGGHSPAGHSVCEGGIVLDLSGMKKLQIDAERRLAWAEAGLTTGEYTSFKLVVEWRWAPGTAAKLGRARPGAARERRQPTEESDDGDGRAGESPMRKCRCGCGCRVCSYSRPCQ